MPQETKLVLQPGKFRSNISGKFVVEIYYNYVLRE